MEIWISKLLGPVLLVLGIPMIITPTSLQETTRRFLADSPLVLISGVLAMTAGLSIVNTHNVWVLDWTLIVTLFGWGICPYYEHAEELRVTDPSNPQFWSMRLGSHPQHDDVSFDLDTVLSSVVSLRAAIPEDAFTAPILGTEREGQGVVIDNSGTVLTIGYLVTEAEEIWLIGNNNTALPAHVLAYDQETGLGLVQALGNLGLPAADIGESLPIDVGEPVIVAGQGGAEEAVNAQVVSVREFAGSWEYLLDDAIFTIPAHSKWSGAGVFNRSGQLIGIGSLYIQQAIPGEEQIDGNMIVPIDILKPIYDDLLTLGRRSKPSRPWLGMTTAEADDRLVVAGLANRGPAMHAGVELGDLVVGVGGEPVSGLSTMFRKIWALGSAGVAVPLTLERDGRTLSITVDSGARADYLKKPNIN